MKVPNVFNRREVLSLLSSISAFGLLLSGRKLLAGRFEEKKFQERMIDRFPPFDDARSRKVIFVAHCIINQNARCNGSAETPASIRRIPEFLLKKNIGIAQIPCPELGCLGLGREGLIYDQLSTPGNRRYLKTLAQDILYQINQYLKHRFEVVAILGINCSPSCGVDCHAYNGRKPGKGAFMEELSEEMEETGVEIPLIGVTDAKPEKALAVLETLLVD